MKISEITLEGNPICENLDEFTYMKVVKEYCPLAKRLVSIKLCLSCIYGLSYNFLRNNIFYNGMLICFLILLFIGLDTCSGFKESKQMPHTKKGNFMF